MYSLMSFTKFATVPGASFGSPVKGSVIVYREGSEPAAKVVGTYYRNLDLVAAPAGTLPVGVDVAVVLTPNYEPPPPSTEPQVEFEGRRAA